jgi:hypothetical protein
MHRLWSAGAISILLPSARPIISQVLDISSEALWKSGIMFVSHAEYPCAEIRHRHKPYVVPRAVSLVIPLDVKSPFPQNIGFAIGRTWKPSIINRSQSSIIANRYDASIFCKNKSRNFLSTAKLMHQPRNLRNCSVNSMHTNSRKKHNLCLKGYQTPNYLFQRTVRC